MAKAENPYIQVGEDLISAALGVGRRQLPAPGVADRLRQYAYYVTENQRNAGDAVLVFDLHEAVAALTKGRSG
jgi:hypothetical protein